MAETKPKSFRVSEATAEKFKEIAGELGGNQQEAMAKLIEAYEFQQGKAVFKKTTEIETFEKYVTLLTRMYMSSLEDNQHINETVHSEFAAQLQSKDAVILDLRGKLEEMELSNKENIALHQEIAAMKLQQEEQRKNLENMLQDKNALNDALTKSYDELCNKLEITQNKQKDIDILKEQNKELKEQVNTLKKELETTKQQHILELERQQFALDKKYQQEKQQEIDKYQQKYFELLENTKKPVNRKTSTKSTEKEE